MPAKAVNTVKFSLANYGGLPIPEKGAADTSVALSADTDIHFGKNTSATIPELEEAAAQVKVYIKDTPKNRPACSQLGARVMDIARRGGRVAEYNWFIFLGEELTDGAADIDSFQCVTKKWFKGFNKKLPTTSSGGNSLADFPSFARYNGAEPGSSNWPDDYGDVRYSGPTKYSAAKMVMGERWSKTALEYALAHGHTIHMHLDGLGDIKKIITKDVSHSFNYGVTALEVRYLYRHWERFKNNVVFYNGYEFLGSTCQWDQAKAMKVEVPWKHDAPAPRPQTDPVIEALKDKHLWT